MKQYLTVQMEKQKSVTEYTNHVAAIQKELVAMGSSLCDEDQLATLFRGLAPQFESTQDLRREPDRERYRAIQMLIAMESEMKVSRKCQ